MQMTNLHIVECKNYNGHKNVLFAMETSDFRFQTENWKDCGPLERFGKNFVDTNGHVYKRFPDWSLKKVSTS